MALIGIIKFSHEKGWIFPWFTKCLPDNSSMRRWRLSNGFQQQRCRLSRGLNPVNSGFHQHFPVRSMYLGTVYQFTNLNYSHLGMIPLITQWFPVRSQWGLYNLPRCMEYDSQHEPEQNHPNWLVVEPTPLKHMKVSWDDKIPNGKITFMFQTTSQLRIIQM